MAPILTLAQARDALNWGDGRYPERDAQLLAEDIPNVTQIITDWCGRMEDRREKWMTDDTSPIETPWPVATIKSVTVRGIRITGCVFAAGILTIADPSYRAGDEVTVIAGGLPVPAPVIEAAGIILAHLWNAKRQGRAGGSEMRGEAADPTPRGFAMPRRAEQLLEPYRIIGGSSWGQPYRN